MEDATISEPISPLLLAARGLALRRGREWLFRDLDLHINPGHLLWLRGPNGSGKTSLLRVLVGLTRPDLGQLNWRNVMPDIVYLGHSSALKEDLCAREALDFLARLHGRRDRAGALDAALKRLGVEHRSQRSVRTLSQGQRRRVALARLALEQTPALWVLDEPFDALDAEGIAVVLQLMSEHLQRQGAVVLTSHLAFELPGVALQILDLETGGTCHA